MLSTTEPVVSVREACERLGVSRQRVHQLIGSGRLDAEYDRARRRWYVHERSLNGRAGDMRRPPGYLSIAEVAERRRVSYSAVAWHVQQGHVSHRKAAGRVWVLESEALAPWGDRSSVAAMRIGKRGNHLTDPT